uniref:Uncharacterized protein n=1 Tax=Pavo cristatus TaxID=9049 RepID=A0A8C9ENU5_PAVCR
MGTFLYGSAWRGISLQDLGAQGGLRNGCVRRALVWGERERGAAVGTLYLRGNCIIQGAESACVCVCICVSEPCWERERAPGAGWDHCPDLCGTGAGGGRCQQYPLPALSSLGLSCLCCAGALLLPCAVIGPL